MRSGCCRPRCCRLPPRSSDQHAVDVEAHGLAAVVGRREVRPDVQRNAVAGVPADGRDPTGADADVTGRPGRAAGLRCAVVRIQGIRQQPGARAAALLIDAPSPSPMPPPG